MSRFEDTDARALKGLLAETQSRMMVLPIFQRNQWVRQKGAADAAMIVAKALRPEKRSVFAVSGVAVRTNRRKC
jgi:hypothetical protein